MIISSTIHKNTELYRIMPLERFIQLLATGMNVLTRPSMWEDPYEKVVGKSIIDIEGRRIPFDETHWYGQCWTRNNESDALWRIFTNGKNLRAVMIKSTSDIIEQSLEQVEDDKRIFFLENIIYPSKSGNDEENLAQTYHFDWMWENGYELKLGQISDYNNKDPENYNILAAPVLLTKRFAFKHEQEVRLLCYCKEKQPEENNKYFYKVPSMKEFLKDEIVVDPWAPKDFDKALHKMINKFLPNNNLTVRQSELYQECHNRLVFRSKFL